MRSSAIADVCPQKPERMPLHLARSLTHVQPLGHGQATAKTAPTPPEVPGLNQLSKRQSASLDLRVTSATWALERSPPWALEGALPWALDGPPLGPWKGPSLGPWRGACLGPWRAPGPGRAPPLCPGGAPPSGHVGAPSLDPPGGPLNTGKSIFLIPNTFTISKCIIFAQEVRFCSSRTFKQ